MGRHLATRRLGRSPDRRPARVDASDRRRPNGNEYSVLWKPRQPEGRSAVPMALHVVRGGAPDRNDAEPCITSVWLLNGRYELGRAGRDRSIGR